MLENLIGQTIIGYACVNDSKITQKNKEQKIQETKAYEKLSLLRGQFIAPENIVIEVFNGSRRNRVLLPAVVDALRQNVAYSDCPKGCIIIPTIGDIGRNREEVAENYRMISDERIGIFVLDNEQLSSCGVDYDFEHFYRNPSDVLALLDDPTENITINDNRGKRREHAVDENFIKLYWYYENYFIPETLTLTNKLIGHFTKKVFIRLCDDYEHSERYARDEAEQAAIEENCLIEKPKRHGLVPEKFPEMLAAVNDGVSVADACSQTGIPSMTDISFERYRLKYALGKSGLGKASFKYKRQAVIEEITP